ncbi:hypothetical protein [Streptomyces jeddahensis]|uniref:Uncharacterized protein n=1 Tax=Streptomyces jeddahensis TaxID=1716141 RepID=A0A177HT21_9ACTN|nr:hypothetical protein [Streptomyces jeddahensis]OAH14025.1 hypothetical protein STSP_27430 [Streptomyces jeddahensis]
MAEEIPGGFRGRRPVLRFLADALHTPPGSPPPRPLLMLLGPRGTGASQMHESALEYFRTVCPVAYLNFEPRAGGGQLSMREVLAALAHQLQSGKPLDPVAFPRLTIGLLATEHRWDPPTRGGARRLARVGITQRLRHPMPSRTRDIVGSLSRTAMQVTSAFEVPGPFSVLAAVSEHIEVSPGRQLNLLQERRGRQWYAGRVAGLTDPDDALVELNAWWYQETAEHRARVERLLLEAFVHDLRAHARGPLHNKSMLVLLDNCQEPMGLEFVRAWARVREALPEDGDGNDPAVIAGSLHEWPAAWGPSRDGGPGEGVRVVGSDAASLADWLGHRSADGGAGSWWYAVRLRNLTRDDVAALAALGRPRWTQEADWAHRLTGGLPWAVAQLARALPDSERPVSPRSLRMLPEVMAERGGPRLVDLALGRLLAGFTEQEVRTLEEWAAAHAVDEAPQVVPEPSGPVPRPLITRLLDRWLVHHGASGELRFLPWLRRLLLWRLAADEERWRRVHTAFHAHAERLQRPADVLYHRLALSELAGVADALTALLTGDQALPRREWVALLQRVCAAPNRLERHPEPEHHLARLATPGAAGTDELRRTVCGLVAAGWLWADPLTDPRGRMLPELAERFSRLAALLDRDTLPLYEEAARFRDWVPPQTQEGVAWW